MVLFPSPPLPLWEVLLSSSCCFHPCLRGAVLLSVLRLLAGTSPSLPSWSRLSVFPSPWGWCRSGASALRLSFRFVCFPILSCVWSSSCHLSYIFSCSVLFFIFLPCFHFIFFISFSLHASHYWYYLHVSFHFSFHFLAKEKGGWSTRDALTRNVELSGVRHLGTISGKNGTLKSGKTKSGGTKGKNDNDRFMLRIASGNCWRAERSRLLSKSTWVLRIPQIFLSGSFASRQWQLPWTRLDVYRQHLTVRTYEHFFSLRTPHVITRLAQGPDDSVCV